MVSTLSTSLSGKQMVRKWQKAIQLPSRLIKALLANKHLSWESRMQQMPLVSLGLPSDSATIHLEVHGQEISELNANKDGTSAIKKLASSRTQMWTIFPDVCKM